MYLYLKSVYLGKYIQANFIKDDGTLVIIFKFYFFKTPCYFSSVGI